MKIGFDVSQTGNGKAGCGYFADSLIQTLVKVDCQDEYILYPHFGTSFWDPTARRSTRMIYQPNVSKKVIGRNLTEAMEFWQGIPPDMEDQLGSPNIVHANNYSCPVGFQKARLVYTLYDLNFLEHPEWTTEQNRCVCFEGVFKASVYADFIVAISRYSHDKFLEFFPHYPAERIKVVSLGSRFPGKQDVVSRGKIFTKLRSGEFWLAVGTLEPRKNLRRLLKAFACRKARTTTQYPLVLAGGKGWLEDDLEEFIQGLGLSNNVRVLGYVADEELSWLYRNCFCFIYPSIYEGFGLPVLEAMNAGAAVITSRSTSLPEVGGDAAHYVDPLNEGDIADALEKLEVDSGYREMLKDKAIIQAKKFSWEKSAFEILHIYHQAVTMPKFREFIG